MFHRSWALLFPKDETSCLCIAAGRRVLTPTVRSPRLDSITTTLSVVVPAYWLRREWRPLSHRIARRNCQEHTEIVARCFLSAVLSRRICRLQAIVTPPLLALQEPDGKAFSLNLVTAIGTFFPRHGEIFASFIGNLCFKFRGPCHT